MSNIGKQKSKYDLIIFDCDGTLVDSEGLIHQSCAFALNAQGFMQFTPEHCSAAFKGISLDDIIVILQNSLGSSFNAQDFVHDGLVKSKELIAKFVKPIENAHVMLRGISHIKKCVASNGEHERVLQSLEATKLKEFFHDDEIFTFRMVPQGKPAPDLFLYAASKMKATPDKCLVVEDSLIGVRAAKAAGMDVIFIKSDVHTKEEESIRKHNPLGVITDLVDLKAFL